jgi:hypothetical protein
MAIFQRLNVEQGITVILVTHEPDIAEHTPSHPHPDGLIQREPVLGPRIAGESVYHDQFMASREC